MSFINTRDTIGDAATVDGLVDHTLSELADDSVYNINSNACYYNDGLQILKLPNITSIGRIAFANNTQLHTVELREENSNASLTIGENAFATSSKLKHLVLNGTNMATLATSASISGTLISKKRGAVYVPSNLVSTYKSNTNWCNFIILDINNYPTDYPETITDSWATILADTNPSAHYSIGDTKVLSLGSNSSVIAKIVGFNIERLASNSNKRALISWMILDAYEKYKFNNTNTTTGGWYSSDIRAHIINDVLPLFESSSIGSYMQIALKSYKSDTSTTSILEEKLWIPSYREMINSEGSYAENTGCSYLTAFSISTNKLLLDIDGKAYEYWTRSIYGNNSIAGISDAGSSTSKSPNTSLYYPLCFCTGEYDPETITDSWATILADTNPSAHYSIGDTKVLHIGNHNLVVQIAGFNIDTLSSDNSKTARITWLLKESYPGKYKMMLSGTTEGYSGSYIYGFLNNTVLPLLEASDVGSELQTVIKTSKTSSTTVSLDLKIWLPSYKEVGGTSNNYIESSGVVYSELFSSADALRIKNADTGLYTSCWLRSIASGSSFSIINSQYGNLNYTSPTNSYCMILGFCTGASS